MTVSTLDSEKTNQNILTFYVGEFGGVIPLIVMIGLMLLLTANGMGGASASWAPGFIALVVGLFLVKNKTRYCEAIMKGIGNKNGVVIIVAWIFAGVLGKIMVAGGLVNGIMWLGNSTGLTGSLFTVIVFFSAALFAIGTGSGNGAALALSPVLFPAGYFLGADPVFVALAIMSGGAFGDNVAPISDTTIISAYTQEAKMQDVVRSRLPLAIPAGIFAIIVFLLFGEGSGDISETHLMNAIEPTSLFLLISLGIVILFALRGKHIVEALTYGIVSASIIGIAIGSFDISELFGVPTERGLSNGVIQNGINSVSGAIIFLVLIMAVIQIFVDSGLLDKLLFNLKKKIAKTTRQAEMVIFGVSALSSLAVSSNGAALLLVGPTIVKPLGESFNLAAARRANLMDSAVCSIFYMMPWSLAVMVWYSSIEGAAKAFNIEVPSPMISLIAPYPWALAFVVMFSIYTGWNRKYQTESELISDHDPVENNQLA